MDLKIHQKKEKELYQATEKIKSVTKEDKNVAANMFDLMKKAKGIGLSAAQVGYNRNIIVVSYGPENHIMYNPEIIRSSDNKTKTKEGCLSFPGEEFSIERPDTVLVTWLNGRNEKKTKMFSGYIARIIQHEVDHNEGITMEMRYNEQNPKKKEELIDETIETPPKKKRGRPKKKKVTDDEI
jgi:peptide deformylase